MLFLVSLNHCNGTVLVLAPWTDEIIVGEVATYHSRHGANYRFIILILHGTSLAQEMLFDGMPRYWHWSFIVSVNLYRFELIKRVWHRGTVFLPPTNEVWEGYVFTGVCLSGGVVHGGWCVVGGMCGGGVHGGGGTCVCGGGMRGEGMHGRVCVWQGVACMAGDTAAEAGGTHPTGMYSCCCILLFH